LLVAIGDPYMTVAEYTGAIDQSETGDSEDLRWLKAVSRLIDRKLDRVGGFNKDTVATFRVYVPKVKSRASRSDWAESENPWKYGPVSRVLDVEDLVSVTSITVDENRDNTFSRTLTTDDYELLPRNASKWSVVFPYNQIELTSWGTLTSWPAGARVKVTGVHGWPAVPDQIKVACAQLVGMGQLKTAYGSGRISELDGVIDTSLQARKLINDLMTTLHGGIYF
jgi:hypothetical protein